MTHDNTTPETDRWPFSNFLPLTIGEPIIVTLHDADDTMLESAVGVVESFEAPEVVLRVPGGVRWKVENRTVAVLVADARSARRVHAEAVSIVPPENEDEDSVVTLHFPADTRWIDERQNERTSVDLPAVVALRENGDNRELEVRISNLGAGGCLLEADAATARFAVESQLFLRFSIDDATPFLVLCEVLSCEVLGEHEALVRLAFPALEDQRRNVLQHFVDRSGSAESSAEDRR
jgi:hypothetical protein